MLRVRITSKIPSAELERRRLLLPEAFQLGMESAVRHTVAHIVRSKLENKGPRYLNRRTGTLIRSLTAGQRTRVQVLSAGVVVQGIIGTNVVYAPVHEYGIDKTVQVSAHTRSVLNVRGRAARAVGKETTARSGRILKRFLGGEVQVAAHSRRMHLPERRPIRDGIDESRRVISVRIARAAKVALSEGRLVTREELEA